MELTDILTQVAEGKLSVADAEAMIRKGPPRQAMRRGKPLLVGAIFAFIGSVFALVGGGIGVYSWSFVSGAREADGAVIQLVAAGGRGGKSPVVRYQVGEQVFEVQSAVSSSPPAYTIGDKVKVLYPVDHPSDGRIHSFVELWLFPTIFGGFGGLFLLIGCIVMLTGRTHWRMTVTS